MNSDTKNYPVGAEYDSSAPYNEPLDKEVEVFISITLSRNVAIGVNGEINEPNLKKEALKQIDIPGLDSDWCVDDFQVIEF